jgi:hypothetical protein
MAPPNSRRTFYTVLGERRSRLHKHLLRVCSKGNIVSAYGSRAIQQRVSDCLLYERRCGTPLPMTATLLVAGIACAVLSQFLR